MGVHIRKRATVPGSILMNDYISNSSKLLFAMLVLCGSRNGTEVGNKQLASLLCWSTKTVSRKLQELETEGVIRIEYMQMPFYVKRVIWTFRD